MKKLFLSIALLTSLSASSQSNYYLEVKGDVYTSNLILSRSNDNAYTPKSFKINEDFNKAYISRIVNSDGSILERVSYRNEKYGSSVDKTKEIEFRKAKIAEYKKLGYTFDGMVSGSNGKFMKFVK